MILGRGSEDWSHDGLGVEDMERNGARETRVVD